MVIALVVKDDKMRHITSDGARPLASSAGTIC